jgi:signal transduction histidine kinase/CheY-like chemotaxis protein
VAKPASNLDFMAGGGEMGERMRALDWSKTALGPPASWPQSLRSPLSMLLPSKAQICLFWGPEFTVLYNDAYIPVFGGKHPKMLGQPGRIAWSEIWDTSANLHGLLSGVVRTGEAFHATDMLFGLERHGFVEDTYFDVSYDPVRDESGAVGGVFCIVAETTGRVVGERRISLLRELAERTAPARSVREACTTGMAVMAGKPDVAFALAYSGEHLLAATPGAEAALAACDPALVKEQPIPGGRLVLGVNPRRPFDAQYASFTGLLASQLSTAIANALAYEEERRRAEALAEIDRAKTAFFSNVSHEFRTPLTLMLAPLEEAVAAAPAGPQRERLEMASRNAQRLQKLVNALLDFSRIEAGRAQGAFQPADLAALTTELASQFRSACERAGLALEVDCPPLGEVHVDPEMWEKIVFNLLSNAFKFTFEGGITVRLRREENRAVLEVRDTGTGIPAAELPHVFERFHRIQGARGRSVEGSGIGLSLVRELVRLHGGEARVESEPGRGTAFFVSLPLGKAHLPAGQLHPAAPVPRGQRGTAYVQEALSWLPGQAAAEDVPAAQASGPRSRILLADDNADMLGYVRRLLDPAYDVTTVRDGLSALRAAREQRFDLVISDVMMPQLDGFELVAKLREDERTRNLPVMLLSARAGEESHVEGLASGADDYVVKPFGARELLARVAARLEIARIRREADAAMREETQALQVLNRVGSTLAAELDLERIVQAVTDAATAVTGAQFGAFFYNVKNAAGESYLLFTISGAPREAFSKFGMPRNTAIFEPTFSGTGTVRVADITKDPRYGKNSPHRGMPKGHLPVVSYLAVPVTSRTGEVIGGLFFGHPEVGVFTERAERLVEGIAAQAAVAFDKAQLYEQRQQLIAKLQEADQRKDEFLATLSHELRNPLAPLRNSLHLLRASASEGSGPIHDIMERQVNHLVRLVDDLLEVSRISRGTFDLKRGRVEVAEIVRNAVETSQPLLHAAQHELSLDLPDGPLYVDGDAVRLSQILANLLNNAARYTDAGGRISVSARVEGGMVRIAVKDNGQGLAPEALPRMFEMFSRGDRSSGSNQGGLGIGLALSRRLAQMHGGTVEGSSEGPGKGAEFTLALPIAADQRAAAPAAAGSDARMPPRRILVVDDNRDAADSLALVLKFLGADVRVSYGGPEALAAFEAYDPAVVLLDIGLPGMDGYEVARRIRSGFPQRRAALVALTGWGQDQDRQRARDAGFDRHLIKPAEIAALQSLLSSL